MRKVCLWASRSISSSSGFCFTIYKIKEQVAHDLPVLLHHLEHNQLARQLYKNFKNCSFLGFLSFDASNTLHAIVFIKVIHDQTSDFKGIYTYF